MARITIKEFAGQSGYNVVSKIRVNTNGYKYVTFADKNGEVDPENIYLGTRFSETVNVGDTPNTGWFINETENAAGEKRFKITDQSGVMSDATLADYIALLVTPINTSIILTDG